LNVLVPIKVEVCFLLLVGGC